MANKNDLFWRVVSFNELVKLGAFFPPSFFSRDLSLQLVLFFVRGSLSGKKFYSSKVTFFVGLVACYQSVCLQEGEKESTKETTCQFNSSIFKQFVFSSE